MATLALDELQRDLLGWLRRVEDGETLIIVSAQQSVAFEIKRVDGPQGSELRPLGLAAGEFVVPEDFDAPLSDTVLEEFEGR
jgi:antitoxin (DNA-binding transcriptional repressor) of toxin-antitoxin stability system